MIEQEATAWPLLEKKKEKAIGPFYYFFFFSTWRTAPCFSVGPLGPSFIFFILFLFMYLVF